MIHGLDYVIIGVAFVLVLLILVQTRGASLGAGFGSGGDVNTVRRGSDKTLHQITIIAVIIFAGSIIATIVS
jgi:preprotein translocase subunit SecG